MSEFNESLYFRDLNRYPTLSQQEEEALLTIIRTGETEENRHLARNAFQKQMKRLEGLEADVAFFPVDGRMGEVWDVGAKEFCARTKIKALVTMHNVGYPAWQPAPGFFPEGRAIPYWTPEKPGEKRVLAEGGFEK